MTSAVFDFKSINKILNRQEQKAEFEAKNPEPVPSMYAWPAGVAVPFGVSTTEVPFDARENLLEVLGQVRADIDRITGLSSLAHPAWPYTGTPHEWRKFKI
jgi:hypothetical protein